MLTYEALVEQARLRGMPADKIRGILREYLQVLVLKEIYRREDGQRLYFTGGTYLRLIHHLKRFSEDLDFNTSGVGKKEFERLLKTVAVELQRIGLASHIAFDHWQNIYTAKFIFPDVEKRYQAVSPYSRKSGIMIKVETNKPKWKITTETEVVNGFGHIYPCVCTEKGALFADKIDALLKKTRARHLYDIIFMLSNQFPINKRILTTFGITEEPGTAVTGRVRQWTKAELKRQAETLRPFLFDEREAQWITDAPLIVPALFAKYGQKTV